jgi:hypothetical protein
LVCSGADRARRSLALCLQAADRRLRRCSAAAMSSASLAQLIADTQRLMSDLTNGAASSTSAAPASAASRAGSRLASPLKQQPSSSSGASGITSPTRLTTTAISSSSTTRTTTYEEQKSRLASNANAAALRSLSPRPVQHATFRSPGRSKTPTPLSPSSGRLFTRSQGFIPLNPPAPHSSPLSPREQARRAISDNGLNLRGSTLTSPLRSSFDVGATFAAGLAASSSARAASASPTRFSQVASASREQAARMDATLRFENLETPAVPVRSRSRVGSPLSSRMSPSPTRFTAARPSALDASAIRAANAVANSYVFAPLEPWRELNRQLALNGYSMVAPFPVPSSVALDLPWSPNSTRFFRGIPVQAPSAALNTLLANFTALLAENSRRGQTIHDLMSKQTSEDARQVHYQAELQALRRANGQLQLQITELQHSLENSSVDRASTLKNLSGQIELSANQFQNLEHQHASAQRELHQREHEVRELRRALEEQQRSAERALHQEQDRLRTLAAEADRAAQVIRERDTAVAHATQRSREIERERDVNLARVRELERELIDCQSALVVTQTRQREESEEASKRDREHVYLSTLRTSEFEEKLTTIQHAAEQDRQANRLRFMEQEEDHTRVRRALEEQVVVSQSQVSELSGLNSLLRSDLSSAQAKSLAQEDRIAQLHRENVLQEERISQLQRESALKQELIAQMEAKVAGLQEQAIHGYNRQELGKYLDAFQSAEQLLQREQLGSSFDVMQVHALPKEILAEIVLMVCMKLKTPDASAIGPALDQLLSVSSAVPGMQAFIAQIWSVVNGGLDGEQAKQLTPENLISLTTSVVPTLRQWRFAHESTSELQRFRLDILDALRRRQHRSPLNPLHSASGASSAAASSVKLHDQLPNEEMVYEVNDIVANENRLNALVYDQHASPNSFFQLWAQLDKTPLTTQPYSQDSERILSHIQQLFDIPHRIGLFPKMNELFLFVNETRPAIQAMRSLLRLDSRATIHTCIKALKKLVEGQGLGGFNESMNASSSQQQHQNMSRAFSPDRSVRVEGNGRGLAWTVTSPSKHESSFINSFAGSSAPSKSQLTKNAQYYTICKQLLAQLGCKKMSEIVVAVSQLQQTASSKSQPDFLTQSVLTQVSTMLECENFTALPSKVMRLKEDLAAMRRRSQVHADERSQLHANHASNEMQRQLTQSREDFIENLKTIIGITGRSDTELVDAISRLTTQAASASAQPSAQQRDHQLIIAQLRGYLDVRSQDEIVPTVRTLINKLVTYDEIYPTLDSMVSRLYDLLHVTALEDIVPAVRRLVVHSNSTAGSSAASHPRSGPIAQSVSAASSVRGVRDSVENSPTLSSISSNSNTTAASDDHLSTQPRGGAAANTKSSPSTVTRTTTTTSHHSSSLYISGKSPYRASTGSSSSTVPVGRVSFDPEEGSSSAGEQQHQVDPLSQYVPESRAQREAEEDAAEVQRQLEEAAIDREINGNLRR